MKTGKILTGRAAVCMAAMWLSFPGALFAAGPGDQGPMVIDVALADGGVLVGQVVDPAGLPKPEVAVAISTADEQLAHSCSNRQGFFAFRGLRGGVYRLGAAEGCGIYRVWAPGTAPPTAKPGALVVAGEDLVRGQICDPVGWMGCCVASNPVLATAALATAVAIPVSVHNHTRSAPASP